MKTLFCMVALSGLAALLVPIALDEMLVQEVISAEPAVLKEVPQRDEVPAPEPAYEITLAETVISVKRPGPKASPPAAIAEAAKEYKCTAWRQGQMGAPSANRLCAWQ